MTPLAQSQLDALLCLDAGWRLVVQPPNGPRLLPPIGPAGSVGLARDDFLQLQRRGWIRLADQADGQARYVLTDDRRLAAERDGAQFGEVALIAPPHLPPGVQRELARCGIHTAAQAHELIRSGRFLWLSRRRAVQYVLRYFTRPRS